MVGGSGGGGGGGIKKVGKYEKILSCIDRSNMQWGDTSSTSLFLYMGVKKECAS